MIGRTEKQSYRAPVRTCQGNDNQQGQMMQKTDEDVDQKGHGIWRLRSYW